MTPIPSIYDEEITRLRDAPWDSQTREVATIRHNQQLTPTTINLDFESDSRNAATQAFPNVQLKGCLFNFTQAIWRKTQSLGIQVDYRNQQDVQLLVRRMTALPLIPLPNLDDYWLNAVADAPPRTDYTRLLDYVAETWMESRLRPETWNHFSTNGPRTSNHLEGWHNKLKKRVGASHPHIFILINLFQKEQAANEVKMVQYTSGGTRRKKSKKYRDVDEKLSNLKADLLAGRKTCVEYGDAALFL
ncbi:hypothetical protein FSP39_017266 [Pinctada imbricata]|uniref:MULE transposase domain-containing protein n=1 Tax=Pinctada imbricata TaxID=66713 RepID=A0AA88YGM2_PINIB|nr:hypothetical protein FSP39_017266 [Pinctada imbricata]